MTVKRFRSFRLIFNVSIQAHAATATPAKGDISIKSKRGHFHKVATPAAIGFVLLCALCDSARAMKPNEITAQIVHAAYRVHTQLGPGLLETVPEQRGDPVGSGKDFRAESAENAERAQGACGVGEAVDMAIPPKTARNLWKLNATTQGGPSRNRADPGLNDAIPLGLTNGFL
jgi:hypothetical protein